MCPKIIKFLCEYMTESLLNMNWFLDYIKLCLTYVSTFIKKKHFKSSLQLVIKTVKLIVWVYEYWF